MSCVWHGVAGYDEPGFVQQVGPSSRGHTGSLQISSLVSEARDVRGKSDYQVAMDP